MIVTFVPVLHGQSGNLDLSFATGGISVTGHSGDVGLTILQQSDRKTVVLSRRKLTTTYINGVYAFGQIVTLSRFNANGDLDPTYGSNGTISFYTGINHLSTDVKAVLQDDQKVIFATTALNSDSTQWELLLYRINTAGQFDSTFGTNGIVRKGIDSSSVTNLAISMLPGGSIIQGGLMGYFSSSTNNYACLIRYLPDGRVDTSYGDNGLVDSIPTGYFYQLLQTGMDQFIFLGNSPPYTYAIRGDGTYDTTFHHTATYNAGPYAIPAKMIKSTDGIFIGYDSWLKYDSFGLSRFKVTGYLDTTFGAAGKRRMSVLKKNYIRDLAWQSDHSLLVLLHSYYYDSTVNNPTSPPLDFFKTANVVIKFLSDGSIDSSFANNGIFILDTLIIDAQVAEAIAVQSDGKILVTGSGQRNGRQGCLLYRLLNQLDVGILNFTTEVAVPHIYPNPVHSVVTLKYDLQSNDVISIDLYDLNGKKMQSILRSANRAKGQCTEAITLDERLSPGNYILRINNQEGSGQSIKLTIQ